MNMDEYGIWIYEYGRIRNATVRKVVFHFPGNEERTEIFLNLRLTRMHRQRSQTQSITFSRIATFHNFL